MRRIAPAFLLVVAALAAAGGATAEPASLGATQSRAQEVLAQVQEIDSELSHVIEAYNLENVKLERLDGEVARNKRHLKVAKFNLGEARGRLADRVVQLYTSGQEDSTVAVLLGARNLDELLDGIETANRVSEQDSRTLQKVVAYRTEVERRAKQLARARIVQARIVSTKAAQRRQIESRLAERRSMLASIRSEIARIRAAEARQQRALAAQVQSRIAGTPPAGQGAPLPDGVGASVPARYGGVVGIAMRYLGVPYRWGGASPSTGFDCSGFTMYVYAQIGVSLPHYTGAQWAMGSPVSRDQLAPGDLVFFNNLGHMGIYIGGNQFIHAPHTGDVVKISSMSGWYDQRYDGARRL
jgi:cell wall-associated NlpC family hydrolase